MVEIAGFEVGEEIGRGGFGVVYRARDLTFGRDVAIKVLRDVPGTDLRQRFLAECRAVGSLGGSPGVPTVYSTGSTADGAPFMAMQLLPGGSLSDRQPLPPDAVIAVGRRLAEALQAAHDGGVVHRDVKPANVLFDADDRPVLVDFGISALIGEATDSVSPNVAVSVAFAPPEVLAGARPEVPGDVYALGATLFCALTARAPFVSTYGYESLATIAARIATAQVEDLRPLGVPDGLARVIEIAMAKDPAARFATMSVFGAALAAVAHGGQVPAALTPVPAAAAASVPVGARGPRDAGAHASAATSPRRRRRSLIVAATAAAVVVLGGAAAVALASQGSDPSPVAGTRGAAPVATGVRGSQAPGSGVQRAGVQRAGGPDLPDGRQSLGLPGSSRSPARVPVTSATRGGGAEPGTRAASAAPGSGRRTSTSAAAPTRSSTVRPTVAPTTPPPNHRPAVSAAGRTANERASVSIPVTVSDRDGDAVSITVAGLPSWLHLSGRTIKGTAPYNAASVTTTHNTIRVRTFSLRITATDSHQARTRTTVALRIRDTLRTMPNFIGRTGKGTPSISAVSVPNRGCAYQKKGDGTLIYWQSVRPGTVITWGRKVTYRYGRNKTSCAHVSGHWPS